LGLQAQEAGPARPGTHVFQPMDTLSLDLPRTDFSFNAVLYYTHIIPFLQDAAM